MSPRVSWKISRATQDLLEGASLRNIIGQHDLDEVLQERNKINNLLRANIADATTRWGIEVERFEMIGCRVTLGDAASDGNASRGYSRKASTHYKGGSRT